MKMDNKRIWNENKTEKNLFQYTVSRFAKVVINQKFQYLLIGIQ